MTKINYQQTSREAWESFLPSCSPTLDEQILAALKALGPTICQDVEKFIGRSHQAVSGNLRHLVERGLVRDSGKKGFTESQRKAIKWEVIDQC